MPYDTIDDKVLLIEQFARKSKTLTVWEITTILGHSAYYIVSIFLALPFLQPYPLNSLAMICGSLIAFSGLLIVAGMKFVIPDSLKRVQLQRETCLRLCLIFNRILFVIRKFLKPRGVFIQNHNKARIIIGLFLAYCGLLLALPLSTLATNTLPSLAIITISLAALEEDEYALFLGFGIALIATVYMIYTVVHPLQVALAY